MTSIYIYDFFLDQKVFHTLKTTAVDIQLVPQEQKQNSALVSTKILSGQKSLDHFPITSYVSTAFKDVEVSGDSLLTLLSSNLSVLNLKPVQLKNSQKIFQIAEILPVASMVSKNF